MVRLPGCRCCVHVARCHSCAALRSAVRRVCTLGRVPGGNRCPSAFIVTVTITHLTHPFFCCRRYHHPTSHSRAGAFIMHAFTGRLRMSYCEAGWTGNSLALSVSFKTCADTSTHTLSTASNYPLRLARFSHSSQVCSIAKIAPGTLPLFNPQPTCNQTNCPSFTTHVLLIHPFPSFHHAPSLRFCRPVLAFYLPSAMAPRRIWAQGALTTRALV